MTLRQMRETRGLTRSKVARHLECPENQVYRWETGEQVPGLLYARKLASLYGLSLEEIASCVLDVTTVTIDGVSVTKS